MSGPASSAGLITIMVPDLVTPTEELRSLCTFVARATSMKSVASFSLREQWRASPTEVRFLPPRWSCFFAGEAGGGVVGHRNGTAEVVAERRSDMESPQNHRNERRGILGVSGGGSTDARRRPVYIGKPGTHGPDRRRIRRRNQLAASDLSALISTVY